MALQLNVTNSQLAPSSGFVSTTKLKPEENTLSDSNPETSTTKAVEQIRQQSSQFEAITQAKGVSKAIEDRSLHAELDSVERHRNQLSEQRAEKEAQKQAIEREISRLRTREQALNRRRFQIEQSLGRIINVLV